MPLPPGAGRRDPQRFGSRVDREGGPARFAPAGHDREANPGARNRGADVDCLRVVAAADGQAAQAFGLLAHIKNVSYITDNAREHGCHLRSRTMRVSAPTDSLATHLSRGDSVSAASGIPSRASTPAAPTTVGELEEHGLVDEIGGKQGGGKDRAALDHQPGDAARGDELERCGKIEPSMGVWRPQHGDAFPRQRVLGAA